MTHQNIDSLHLCQSLQIPVSMVQIEGHTADLLEVGASRKLQLGVAPLQQLVVVLDAPLVVALNEGHFEGALRLADDRQVLPVVLHYLRACTAKPSTPLQKLPVCMHSKTWYSTVCHHAQPTCEGDWA